MRTLKGQNLRIYTEVDSQENHWKVVSMATNCTITLTNNTEESLTKDDLGMANKPVVVSHGWSVQVDSMDVLDAAAMLTAIKTFKRFKLMWTESNIADNQTAVPASYSFQRYGYAFINDLTLTFNDRETAAKSVQFLGDGWLLDSPTLAGTEVQPIGSITKGQYVRLFLGQNNLETPTRVIAAAKQLSFHVSVQFENTSTKDTEENWVRNEPVGISYDITTNALVKAFEDITSEVQANDFNDIESDMEGETPIKFRICNVDGANNRTIDSDIVSGSVVMTSLVVNAPNRQTATYTATMQGYGIYEVAA